MIEILAFRIFINPKTLFLVTGVLKSIFNVNSLWSRFNFSNSCVYPLLALISRCILLFDLLKKVFFVRKFLKYWIACVVLKRRYQTAAANPCKILNVEQMLFTVVDSIKFQFIALKFHIVAAVYGLVFVAFISHYQD